jgi:hypothetical protein
MIQVEKYGKWSVAIIAEEDMNEADELIKQERLDYYNTPQKKLDYLAQIIYEVHYDECDESGALPRLDRTAITII